MIIVDRLQLRRTGSGGTGIDTAACGAVADEAGGGKEEHRGRSSTPPGATPPAQRSAPSPAEQPLGAGRTPADGSRKGDDAEVSPDICWWLLAAEKNVRLTAFSCVAARAELGLHLPLIRR